jgi:hypothetical protein
MVLGMSLATFTMLHVIISLIGIFAGFVVVFGMFGSNRMKGWTAIFLAMTILTSVTGFFFPFTKLLPSHIVGIISLIVLAIALLAYYVNDLNGSWRRIYVAAALLALYLNVFVAVVQAFLKIQPLKELAPTQSEPPFMIAQGVVLLVFIALFVGAVRAFHPDQGVIRRS